MHRVRLHHQLAILLLAIGFASRGDAATTFPSLPGKIDTVSITESASAGSTIYTLTASGTSAWDLKGGDVACTTATLITLSANSGVSSVNLVVGTSQLDYETNKFHVCLIEADDGSGPATATVTVSVVNAWDVTPTASTATISGTVKEEQPPGTAVMDTAATPAQIVFTFNDAEIAGSSDVLTCGLSGTSSGLFNVATAKVGNTYTCTISTRVSIDRESLAADNLPAVYVTATDTGGLVGSATISVSVIDINDNTPTCPTLTYTKTISEVDTSGTMATIASCTDADAGVNADLVYAFVGTYTGFSLTGNVVTLTAPQDYDTITANPVVMLVTIRDNAATVSEQRTITATVSVQVTSVNDNTPTFSSLSPGLTLTIAESAALGTTLFTQGATDADKAGEPDSTLTWSILSAQSTTPVGTTLTGHFTIDNSGTIKLGTQPLDYETWQVAELVVKVADNSATTPRSVTRTLTISLTDVNEFAPTFTPSNYYKVSLAENNVENYTVLNTFSYSDPDKSALPVWCEIISGNTDSVFRFNTTNRNVLELAKTIEPDKATNHPLVFYIEVLCKDNNGTSPFKSSTATIEVDITTTNDNTPTITGTSACTTASRCSEATTLSGSTVGTFNVNDNDVGTDGVVDCRIIGPAGAPFVLQGCTSVLLSGSLDYETATSYALQIEARDRGSPSRANTLTMNIYVGDVDDNAPYCSTYSYSFNVNENQGVGSAVGTINCRDADNAGVIYTLVPATVPFTVAASGSNAVISVGTSPDYESVTSYTFVVRTTDQGSLGRTTDATVIVQVLPVNEFTPTFTDTTISVAENTTPGTVVTTFAAVDADTGGHGIVSYSIQAATNGGTAFFSISNSAQVSLIKSLDYETTTQYVLTVRSTDGGGSVGTGLLTIQVTDVNDNSPVCTNAQVTLSMAENAVSTTTATGTQPVATDADSAALYGKIAYSIASGNTGNYFAISSTTGTISRSSTGGLDYEALTPPYNYYNLTIHAIDENGAGPNTATCLAKVTVTDVEEGAPVFGTTIASATGITESSAVGTLVYTPTYTHVDKWDVPVFSILSSNGNFSIDSATGKVYIASALDYETASQHVLVLVATDKNGNTGSMTLTVPVGNVNEFSPVCSPMSTIVNIDENDLTSPSFPKNVMTFSCSDGDAGTTLLYSVTKVNGTAGSTGYQFISNILRTTAALNYETAINAILEITISDQGPGTANILTVTVTVSVNPVNEYTPAFTASTLTPAAVAENVAVGTNVASLVATDSDQGSTHATLKYAILSGNSKGFFTLAESTGVVTTAKSLDYEDATQYLLTVSVTDGPGLSSTATLTINLSDVNDNSPVFTYSTYSVTVDENAGTGSVLLSFAGKVSDADGSSPNKDVTLSLVTTGTPFQLVSNQLELTTGGTLNAATNPSYSLVIRATDGAAAPATQTTDAQVIVRVIAVNTATPTFSGTSTVSAAEDTAVGTLICIVNASDADSGLNGKITYSVATGNTDSDFTIDANNGNIRLNNALDFDSGTKIYYLGIQAIDSGSPAKSSTWTLTVSVTDVNDNAPIWWANNTYSISISEAVTTPSNIYQSLVSDPDTGAGGTITYSLLSQTGTAPDGVSALFAVDTVGAIRVVAQPDREFMSTYYVNVQACDGGSPSLCSQRLFTIYITDTNDNTPDFGLCPKEISVSEAATNPTIISTITASDADTGANGNIALYSLTSADGGASSPTGFFTVSTAGVISTAGALDRESKSVYQFYINAEDSGSPTRRTGSCLLNITITDVNDNAPVVTGQPIITSVSEAATGGTIFYTIVSTDADIGANAILAYQIIAFTPANNFSVNNNGQLSVFASNMLDRERNAAYNLTLRVRDMGTPSQSTTFTVSINILDVNDNTPSFGATSISRSVDENSAVDTAVGAVVAATDPDLGENASLTYQIASILVPTSGGDYFKIDALTGQVKVKVASLDREVRDTYILRLTAQDNGSPALTGTTTLTITIADVNDNDPVFTSTYTSGVSVDENSVAGTAVTTFTATDADLGANAAVTYSIDTSRLNGTLVDTYFQVGASTGALTVKTAIDRETYSMLQFYIIAQDGGSPSRTTSASVNIYINDVNDHTPIFNPSFYNTEMCYNENRTAITLATLKATDADATGNTITYGWGSSSSNFVVNTATGAVTPAYGQTTTKNTKYVQYPTATDSGSPQRTATATIRIDTYDPTEVAVCITYTLSEANFLTSQTSIESALSSTLQFKYATVKCKTWRYTVSSSTEIKACHYCVQDNSTDSASNLANAKSFVTQSELLTFWRLDSAGTPTAMLQSSSFSSYPITKVEGYTDSTSSTSTPWYQTPWGIAIIVLSSVLGASLLGVGIGALANYLCNKSPKVPVTKSTPKVPPKAKNHPPAQPRARPNENKNVYRDRNVWRGTPDFGRSFQNSPGELQRTGISPNSSRVPTPVS
ncbi:hypothetical protein BOX15_Mlig002557g1 [Macrostomum lignano]|uniref:Cadherin domain-containing protein n=1 Tax=Macrostomum lignano TaxID=282301 RepID=A0A267ER84_9PLAT|nr:hypothetical protein BOX15_Mlig002557g1 [Macrostomum lignano]